MILGNTRISFLYLLKIKMTIGAHVFLGKKMHKILSQRGHFPLLFLLSKFCLLCLLSFSQLSCKTASASLYVFFSHPKLSVWRLLWPGKDSNPREFLSHYQEARYVRSNLRWHHMPSKDQPKKTVWCISQRTPVKLIIVLVSLLRKKLYQEICMPPKPQNQFHSPIQRIVEIIWNRKHKK